ncbi:MAG TPA: heavy metal translocating P-type ATPase [Geobacteraceae bacterium]|nr:heavy metal translocating P-type ATPase [Geobacteraceae bacterium]
MNQLNRTSRKDIPLDAICSCCHEGHSHDGHDTADSAADVPLSGDPKISRFLIQKMDCPTEERMIRDTLGSVSGIHRLDFNLLDRELTVHHDLPDTGGIISLLNGIDMSPLELGESLQEKPARTGPYFLSGTWWLLGISGAAAVASEIISWTTGRENSPLVMALATASILAGGLPTLKRGWTALKNLSLNISFLMSVAAIGAIAIGQWPEAAVVIWLFAIAERIESLSLDRARNAIRGLMAITPETATVRDESGRWREVEAAGVRPGETVRVRPGERVPLDGVVTAGHSSVNQAPITGESLPVEKVAGDTVFAGTINENGVLEFEVTGDYEHTTLSRIIHAVQEAQAQRAPTQRLVDAFARRYTPAVVAIALLVAVIPPLLMGAAWNEWIYKALVILVISCPCALVISIPVTVVSGLAAAAHHGILVKGGLYLEGGRKLRFVALDKTGTMTRGKPVVTDVIQLDHTDVGDILRIAAGIEEHAGHPIARSIVERWKTEARNEPAPAVIGFTNMPGRGVSGEIDGKRYYLGNQRLVKELEIDDPALEEALNRLEQEGKTAVALASDAGPLAVIGVADILRDSGKRAIASLHDLGIKTLMLSGDNHATVKAIGDGAGIDDARGNLLPDDKLNAITELQRLGSVGMAGDGINDAPALARADIGFAMGAAGSDTALETADVALMDDDLHKIPDFIRLSRGTWRIIVQNVVFALAAKVIFFGLALAGEATLWMAVFADMGVSLLVVFNSLRLLRFFNGKEAAATFPP